MPSLAEVHFQNYRSFLDAKCRLSPVTVVIGANNAGKSNFLRGVEDLCNSAIDGMAGLRRNAHRLLPPRHPGIALQGAGVGGLAKPNVGKSGEIQVFADSEPGPDGLTGGATNNLFRTRAFLYALDASVIGTPETDKEKPIVHPDGEGVTRVLQALSLKHRKQFQKLEEEFRSYLSEIDELTFERADQGKWFIQVKEKGFSEPVSLSELSEGSRTILALLTILYQPSRPELILIEDVEHAIHPRGLKPMVETFRRMSKEHGVQIIMTTQSPYVLDCFQAKEYWADVVIVEKADGVSRLTNADERLVALGYDEEKMESVSLGDVWFSGLLGGVAGPNELWD